MSLSPSFEPDAAPAPRARGSSGAIGRAQLARLFRLVVVLQTERFPNARELAEQCEVSRRTTYRDLELLAAAGIAVVYRPEHQGYQLAKGFSLRPPDISESEALALLVLSRHWDGGEGLGLLRDARAGAHKIVQGLTTEARDRVLSTAEPFFHGPDPVLPQPERQAVHEAILHALGRQRQLRLWYQDASTLGSECTKLGIYRVVLHDRQWFLVGRSSLVRRIDAIGVARVRRAVVTDDRYVIPPRFDLERVLAKLWGGSSERLESEVRLRLHARSALHARAAPWNAVHRIEVLPDGQTDLLLEVEGLEEVLPWVVGFGDDVEVIAPEELRERLIETAVRLVRLYDPPRPVVPPPRD